MSALIPGGTGMAGRAAPRRVPGSPGPVAARRPPFRDAGTLLPRIT